MKNIPKEIYLVMGLNNNDEEVENFNELDPDNITWSEERKADLAKTIGIGLTKLREVAKEIGLLKVV